MINWIKNWLYAGCFHDWGQWEDCPVGVYRGGELLCEVEGQIKQCKKCGIQKVRRVNA